MTEEIHRSSPITAGKSDRRPTITRGIEGQHMNEFVVGSRIDELPPRMHCGERSDECHDHGRHIEYRLALTGLH